jgi:hypothetical protein
MVGIRDDPDIDFPDIRPDIGLNIQINKKRN